MKPIRRDGDDEPTEFRQRAILQFTHEEARRIDGAGKYDLACGYNLEAKAAVIRIVANENDKGRASDARRLDGFVHQLGAEPDVAMVGIDGDRPEQGGARTAPDRDLGHPERRDELPAEMCN